MLDKRVDVSARQDATRRPALDFQAHIADLEVRGLLVRVDRPINKDTELHPLVRWQFLGGIAESARRAFLFTNVIDAKGRRYDMPVAVGALAASPDIYAVGMGERVEDIGAAWMRAIADPIAPVAVTAAPCQEVVISGEELRRPGHGLASTPAPAAASRTWACTGRRSRRPTGWRCAWWRGRAAVPAAIIIGSNTGSATSRCRSP